MAAQSSVPLFNSPPVPTMGTMDSSLFFGANEAGGPDMPDMPCICNGTRCERCYLSSPLSPAPHNHAFTGLDSFNPSYSDLAMSSYNDGSALPPSFELPQRPLRPAIYTNLVPTSFNYQSNIEEHLAGPYTLGDRSGTRCVQPNETLLTPVTTAASGTEDAFDMAPPIPVNDLIGKGREQVLLEYQLGTFESVRELADSVNMEGYRIHSAGNETGFESGIRALQKALSFHLKERVPATTEQLKSHLRSVRATQNSPSNRVDIPFELGEVLRQYGLTSDAHFQLGVVSKGSQSNSYNANVYGFGNEPILWLFYDMDGDDTGAPDQWSAIIPNDSNNTGSYAAALARPAPMARPKPAINHPTDPTRLYPGYSKPVQRANRSAQNARRQPTSPRSVNGRAGKGNRREGTRGRRSGSGSHTPSEAGGIEPTKNHVCPQCQKGFLYPKDLRRHETTHSHRKGWKCPFCPKDFTRKDNMSRHMANDHVGLPTPPVSIDVAN